MGDIHTVINDFTACRFVQPKQGSAKCSLAAAGFADKPEGLAPSYRKADIFDGANKFLASKQAALYREVFAELIQFNKVGDLAHSLFLLLILIFDKQPAGGAMFPANLNYGRILLETDLHAAFAARRL